MQIKFDLKDIYALADDLKVAVDQVPFAASKTVNECAIPSTAAKSESGSRRPGPTATRLPPQVVRAGAGGLDAVFKISLTGLTTTPMATIVRKSELARELGVSRARISQFVAYGLPVRDDGFIDLEQAAQWVLDNIIDQWTDGASPAVRNAQEILWGSR